MAVKLNSGGLSKAKELINGGKVDETSAWSMSAADENRILGNPPDWTAYSKWFLGNDDSQKKDTKAAWKYPFGKNGKLYRSALRAIRSRASQQNETGIFDAAGTLLGMLDKKKGNGMKNWYEIKAQGDNAVEIIIYEDIGIWGISAKQFITDFKQISPQASVNLRINSSGGNVFDGIAIHNVLSRHPGPLNVFVDGLAASIASLIAMAGKKIMMPENTFMMIHDPLGAAMGNATDMRDFADVLDKFKTGMINTYASKSGQTQEKIAEMMSEETWLTAQEAKDLGFADEVTAPMKLAARADLSRFQNPPALLAQTEEPSPDLEPDPPAQPDPPAPPAQTPEAIHAQAVEEANARAREVYDLCAKAGVPEAASEFLNRGMTVEQVKERMAEAGGIRDACAAAKLPDRATGYIKQGLTLIEVRGALFDVLKAREVLIDNKLGPDAITEKGKSKIDYKEILGNYGKKKQPK